MKILFYVPGDESEHWLRVLERALPQAQLKRFDEALDNHWQADYALVWNAPPALFEGQRQLKGIVNLGAGVDKLLVNPALPADVPIYKLQDAGMAAWMTDYVRYGLLHVARDMDRYRTQQASTAWQPHPIDSRADWPIGIMGLGAIGREVASALSADGYPVAGWSRSKKQLEGIDTFAGDEALDDFLCRSRLLVNLLPATPTTQGLLNRARLAKLPHGAMIVSCGRGEVIDEPALLKQLDSAHLRGALLDVFVEEPLPGDNPLWRHPSVLVTPHIAAPTPVAEAASQIRDLLMQLSGGRAVVAVDRLRGY